MKYKTVGTQLKFTNIRIAFIIEIILRYYFPYFKLIISSKRKIHNWYYEKRANRKIHFFFSRKPDFWLHVKSQMISNRTKRLPWNYHYFALFFCCSVSFAWFCTRYECKKSTNKKDRAKKHVQHAHHWILNTQEPKRYQRFIRNWICEFFVSFHN